MPNKLRCGNHFAVYIIYQVIMFYSLNWYNLLCQLHLNKTGKIKWVSCKQQKKKKVIYIVVSIDSSVFFKSLSSISLYGFLKVGVFIYLLKNILIASSFGNYDQWFINILYTFPCGHKFFISWGNAQEQDAVLRVLLKICLVFSESARLSSKVAVPLYTPI